MHADAAFVQAVNVAGVAGCVTKGETAETILEAIEAVTAGKSFFTAAATGRNASAPPLASKAEPFITYGTDRLFPARQFPNAVASQLLEL